MAHIAISINGITRAAIRCDGFDVVALAVLGTRVDQELATVHVSSSQFAQHGESTYLIWIDEALVPGQTVSVAFSESGPNVGVGKTIDELHPDDAKTETKNDFKPTANMLQQLRARSKVRQGWRFTVRGPSESQYEGRTTDAEHGFGFNVLWNTYRPERASYSLHSYDLDILEERTPMRDHVRGHLEFGTAVELVVAD